MHKAGAALAVLLALIVAAPVQAAQGDADASAKKSKKKGWKTLRGQGGFSVRVPQGYRLTVDQGGYEIAGPGGKMTLLAVRTTGPTRTVAEALLGGALPATPNADQFGLTLKLKSGNQGEIYFSKAPRGVAVTLLEPGKKKGKKGGKGKRGGKRASASAAVGNGQRKLFSRIAGSARNVGTVNLPTTKTQEQEPEIPLKPFTTTDGSAKAMVPNAPGWVAGGKEGIVEGYSEHASYAFGVPIRIIEPSGCFFPPCPGVILPYMPVQRALQEAWPKILAGMGVRDPAVQIVSQIPGSAGVLGVPESGMFQIRFQANGKAGTGYVIAGTASIEPNLWLFYYSYIAAYDGVPGTVGDALLRTWQSWDPSVNQAERQAQTIITQQETMSIIQSSNEYRRAVYEKTNYNWSTYIKGGNPVLAPVAQGAIGEGGVTLVQGSDGKFFDFAGNQFKNPGE